MSSLDISEASDYEDAMDLMIGSDLEYLTDDELES
jgi:hypothetical protein